MRLIWFPFTVPEVLKAWGGKAETSSSNIKGETELPRGQRSRPGYLPECGPAAGPTLRGWGLRDVVSSMGFIQQSFNNSLLGIHCVSAPGSGN